MMTIAVRSLDHLGGWRFRVEFSDGATAEWDYSAVKRRTGPMAESLKDEAFVARAFLEMGAPTWPNGWDASPEALYAELKAAGALTPARAAE